MYLQELLQKRSRRDVVVGLLLAIHFTLLVTSAKLKSATYDEPAHLMSGLTYWHFNDYRLNPENGNLPQRLIAIPVMLFADYRLPPRDQPAWQTSDVWTLSDQFLADNRSSARKIIALGRISTAVLSTALCLTVFLWSQKVFGVCGGVVSLAVAAFSPTLMAHGRLMTSDTCFTLFFILSAGAIWSFLNHATLLRLSLTGVAVGALFLSKLSAVLLIPVAIVLSTIIVLRKQPWSYHWFGHRGSSTTRTKQLRILVSAVMVVTLFTWGTVWAAFGGRFAAASPNGMSQTFYKLRSVDLAAEKAGAIGSIVTQLNKYRLLPEAWNYGAAFIAVHRPLKLLSLSRVITKHSDCRRNPLSRF